MVLVDSTHEDEPLLAPKFLLGHTAPRFLWHSTAPMTQLPLVLVPTYLVPTFLILHLTALYPGATSRQISNPLPHRSHRHAPKSPRACQIPSCRNQQIGNGQSGS